MVPRLPAAPRAASQRLRHRPRAHAFGATIILACAAGIVACGSSERPVTASASRTVDSAGVDLVTTPAADIALPWTLTELFRLGGADTGPGSFTRIAPSLVGTDAAGRIVVLDVTQYRVEVYDPGGRFERFLGGRGSGPGELEGPEQLVVSPDGEVGVRDYAKQAVVRWSAAGQVLPEERIAGNIQQLVRRGDTAVLVQVAYNDRVRTTALRMVTGADSLTLATHVNATSGMVMFSCIGLNSPPLFSPSLVWHGDADRLATSEQVPYAVDIFERGRLVRRIRRELPVEAPTRDHVARQYPNGMQVRFGNGGVCTVPVDELVEKQGLAERLPQIEELALDRSGRLWVQRFGIGDEPRQLDVFDAQGRYVGTLDGRRVPLAFVGPDVVLFAEQDDETGLAYIVAYRFAAL